MITSDCLPVISLSLVTVDCTMGGVPMATENSLLMYCTALEQKLRWNRSAGEVKWFSCVLDETVYIFLICCIFSWYSWCIQSLVNGMFYFSLIIITVYLLYVFLSGVTLIMHVISERELTFAICYRPSVCRLSVCVTTCALLRRFKFSAIFLWHWYLGHPLTSTENFTEIVPGEPLHRGS